MQNLTVPSSDIATAGRKRQRSNSLNSATSSSSPKRAASEDPTLSLDASFNSFADPTDNCDDPMSDATDHAASPCATPPTYDSMPPALKLARIQALRNSSLNSGDTWYLVSKPWIRHWEKAMTGEEDKDGTVEEKDIGPVDNSPLVTPHGELLKTVMEDEDFELVPEETWSLFVSWYGKPQHPLPRSVILRGNLREPKLELYPPRLRVFRLIDEPWTMTTSGSTEYHVRVSSDRLLVDVLNDLARAVEPALENEFRVWAVGQNDSSGGDWPSGKLLADRGNATIVEPNEDPLSQSLIEDGDVFIVEFKKDGKWIMTMPDKSSSENKPMFGSQTDFFSSKRFQPSDTRTTVSTTTATSLLKPAALISSSRFQKSIDPGTLGLGNLGNTCFMNSAIQCLAHTREIADYFLTEVFNNELNPDNPLGMGGAIAESFGALLARIWSTSSQTSSYSPREFKQVLSRFAPQFSGYQQHDSQELVAFLLDGLHEDLNRVLKKPYVEKPDWEGGGDLELVKLAQKSWEGYMKRNDSVIVDLFQNQYRSTLVCPKCSKVSITFDPFMYLTLPLPVHKKWQHFIHYVPADPSKPHLKIPVMISQDASFREVRQLLGRWMNVNPDHLMTMEVFSNKFYKTLDDTVLVSDMQTNDVIFCYELPCPTRMLRSAKVSDTDPFLVPVFLADTTPSRTHSAFTRSTYTNFGWPLIVAIDHDDARSIERIEERVVEQLSRWTKHARELWSWETSESPEVQISLMGAPIADAVTEIKENGDVVVQETQVEEGDIVDEKALVLEDDDLLSMETALTSQKSADNAIRRLGVKKGIFNMNLQANVKDYGSGITHNGYGPSASRFVKWESRCQDVMAETLEEDPVLLARDDAIVLEFEDNMKEFYFGVDSSTYQLWETFKHPEFVEAEQAAKSQIRSGLSLQDCLDEFTKEEQLGEDDLWYCPTCKEHQQATKKFDLWGVPDVLVVHLKRFSNSRTLRDKIETHVEFPLEGLDLTEMAQERKVLRSLRDQGVDISELGVSDDLEEPLLYDLFAVDEHIGGIGGGHYRAYAYNHVTDKWYHFDDSYVSQAKPQESINSNAYLLFYRRRSSRPLGGKTWAKIEEARLKLESATSSDAPTPMETESSQLPTPPNEPAPPVLPRRLGDRAGSFSQARWTTPGSMSSPSSSPPPVDSAGGVSPPSFEDAQYDDVLQSSLNLALSPGMDMDTDNLTLATRHFDYGSSKASPSSSNEVELDSDDESARARGWAASGGQYSDLEDMTHNDADNNSIGDDDGLSYANAYTEETKTDSTTMLGLMLARNATAGRAAHAAAGPGGDSMPTPPPESQTDEEDEASARRGEHP